MSMSNISKMSNEDKNKLLIGGSAAVGGSVLFYESPASAQTAGGSDAISSITSMVTSLGAITAAVVAVVVGAMGVRMAIKFVNRLTVKG